jgi:hypothetical protein
MRKEYDFSKGQRGAVIEAPGKERITIMLDADILAFFRAGAEKQGIGYQTMINAALRKAIEGDGKRGQAPVTETKLRQILREELLASKS